MSANHFTFSLWKQRTMATSVTTLANDQWFAVRRLVNLNYGLRLNLALRLSFGLSLWTE